MENKYISFDDLQDIFETALDKALEEYREAKSDFEYSPMDTAAKMLTCNIIQLIVDTLDEYRNELMVEDEDD